MKQLRTYPTAVLALAACAVAGAVSAQSTGGFSQSSSGSAAAGGSATGMVVPWTVRMGSSAPTQPGHTITPVDPRGYMDRGTGRAEARSPSDVARDDADAERASRLSRK